MELKSKKCIPCTGKEPRLTPDQIDQLMLHIKDWKLEHDPDKITKQFEFGNFTNAINFTNKVAELAQEEGHHPNIYVHSFDKVKLELWTHKIGGLHENDFILASKIDELI